jgi:tRNA1Val (adenine37-N6)-methyltransferase
MANTYFKFKQFQVNQEHCAMKVTTDACLFGAWITAHTRDVSNILDIGAGTGVLMLMLAQKNLATLDGIEIDMDCAKQLERNLAESLWSQRLTAIHADVRNYNFKKKYDLIISNPPFYEQQLKGPEASRNKAMHSTELGLQELMAAVEKNLSRPGQFAILLPFSREHEATTTAATLGLYVSTIAKVRHSEQHPWYRVMILFSRTKGEISRQDITIHDARVGYSDHFTELLKDYYLRL